MYEGVSSLDPIVLCCQKNHSLRSPIDKDHVVWVFFIQLHPQFVVGLPVG